MIPISIWVLAALCYVGFRAWYDDWRGPLRPEEIERAMARMAGTSTEAVNDLGELRRFLEQDDGREFVMLNLVRLHSRSMPHPDTGETVDATRLLRGYLRAFLPSLLRRGGVPFLQSRKIGPYIDAWGVEPDPGWTIVGLMRYRSRRDPLSLATDPRFVEAHPQKLAAIANTCSFPTRLGTGALVGPRVWVALAIAIVAALAQIALS